MSEREIKFTLRTYKTPEDLTPADKELLARAKAEIKNAYAPYSKFRVAAALLMENGEIVTGTNQENASYPAGICAEGAALCTAGSLFPQTGVKKIAITIKAESHVVDHPVAPCGVCRQKLMEYETRFNNDIEIFLMGETGEVYAVDTVKNLLPLNFSNVDL